MLHCPSWPGSPGGSFEAASKVGGMRAIYYVNQVVNLIEGDLIDDTDEALTERLRYLGRLLEKRMAVLIK